MAKETLDTVLKADKSAPEATPVQRRPRSRTPVGGPRNVLKLTGTDPRYKYRVVNNVGDRVDFLLDRGYEVVTDPTVRVGDARAGKTHSTGSPVEASVGQGVKGIVMRIKREWYDEDQAEKQAEVKATEDAMYQRAKRVESDYGDIQTRVTTTD